MKTFLLLVLMIVSLSVHAENQSELASDILDILNTKEFATRDSEHLVEEVIKIEDEIAASNNVCKEVPKQEVDCIDFLGSSLAKSKKDDGWKVLFEAKYRPIDKTKRQANASLQGMISNRMELIDRYETAAGRISLSSHDDVVKSAQEVSNFMGGTVRPEEIQGLLVVRELTRTANEKEYRERHDALTKNMNHNQFLNFLSSLAGWGHNNYNSERALFQQTPQAGKGVVTAYDMITRTKDGICGDIHGMIARSAESRGWEAVTVGYALRGEQHVVAAVVDPSNPDKLMIVNYANYEEQVLNEKNSYVPIPTDQVRWTDVGTQFRVFKNTGAPGEEGKMKQIGTVPNALGSFLKSLFLIQSEDMRMMSPNNNYSSVQQNFSKVKTKDPYVQKDHYIEKKISEGVTLYTAETRNSEIIGIAANREVFKKLYMYDPKLGRCVQRKTKFFSVGVASSLIDFPEDDLSNSLNVYLNIKGGQILNLYETPSFKLKGLIGYEADGFLSWVVPDYFLGGDADFATFLKAMVEYKKNGSIVYGALGVESVLGLKNQQLMTDLGQFIGNVNPLTYNATKAEVKTTTKLNSKTTFSTDSSLTLTRIGDRVAFSSGLTSSNFHFTVGYSNPVNLRIGSNALKSMNFLRNLESPDGFKLAIGSHFKSVTNDNGVSLTLVTTMNPKYPVKSQVQLKTKIEINPKKRK